MQQKDFIRDLRLTVESTTVLFPFVDGKADPRTIAFVKKLAEMGENVVWANVAGCRIGYGLAFSCYWNRDGNDLIIIEHDVLPTLHMLWEMVTCTHEICVQLYKIHPASTNLPKSVYCMCKRADFDKFDLNTPSQCWLLKTDVFKDEFVTFSGFGFIRFRASVQRKVKPSMGHYEGLDYRFCVKAAEVLGNDFIHVHYPEMPHFHGKEVL